jgi:hypothetical protein
MKLTTWNRDSGFVSVVLFDNGTSAAVSTKVFKTQKGAEGFNKRIVELCGEKYEKANLPWESTNPKTGEVTRHFRHENLTSI